MSAPLQAGWFDNITSYFRKAPPATPPKIRVLIVHDKQGVVLEVKGKYKMHDPHNGDHLTTRFVGKRKFIQAVRDGLKWGEEFPGVHQLMIVPDEKSTTTIVDGIEYKGPIYVYDIGGTISIINEVGIEDYLSSTLAQKYAQDTSPELLNAIAITARTAAYYAVENPKNQYWSVDSQQIGYQGAAVIVSNSEMEKAINETRYMIMSNAAPGEVQINPFPAEWNKGGVNFGVGQQVVSRITLADAAALAQKGDHAAQILSKAFPGVKIELIHYAPEKGKK
jgi:Stage II sporulation protein.